VKVWEPQNILAVVIEVEKNFYKLRTKHVIINQLYKLNIVKVEDKAFVKKKKH